MLLNELASKLGCQYSGDADKELFALAKPGTSNIDDLVYLASLPKDEFNHEAAGCWILSSPDFKKVSGLGGNFLYGEDARALFVSALHLFDPYRDYDDHEYSLSEIDHGTSFVSGSGCVFKKGVFIGNNVTLMANVYLGRNVIIGNNVTVYPGVTILDGTILGNNITIFPGTVLGADGFGYDFNGTGFSKVPQIGNVVIRDNVEIGANTTIDRATIGSTVIGEGCKIDNLVQIAHNCTIGDNCIIAAMCAIAGSCEFHSRVILGGAVGVSDHVILEEGVVVGGKTTIPMGKRIAARTTVWGNSARPLREELKAQAIYFKLPELYKKIKQLLNE